MGKVRAARAQTTVFLSFLREDGAWKFNLLSLFDFTDATLGAIAKQKNLTHAQMIDEELLRKYGPGRPRKSASRSALDCTPRRDYPDMTYQDWILRDPPS